MGKRGFTLVELLVVIAIVAILAAMITPVLLEAKDAARMKNCLSNMRQMAMAIHEYMDDHSGYGLPLDRTPVLPSGKDHSNNNPWILFVKPLRKYIKQEIQPPRPDLVPGYKPPKGIWVCSGDIWRGPMSLTTPAEDRPCWWHWGSSYMYPGTTAYISKSVTDPEATDFVSRHPSCVPLKPMTWRSIRRDFLLADYWFDFHKGRRVPKVVNNIDFMARNLGIKSDVVCINVVFLDLHAAAVTPAQRDDLIDNVKRWDNPYYNPVNP